MVIDGNEKVALMLPVMEQFYTLQGEGFHQGRAAYFIRLGGCDVGCVWCDVKDSWEANKHPLSAVEELVGNVKKTKAGIVVITGGEPLMHNLDDLTQQLQQAGLKTHIETSGAHPLSGRRDWICLSPKKFKGPTLQVAQAAHELKVIIFNKCIYMPYSDTQFNIDPAMGSLVHTSSCTLQR
jgi:organic radical activating enzyme